MHLTEINARGAGLVHDLQPCLYCLPSCSMRASCVGHCCSLHAPGTAESSSAQRSEPCTRWLARDQRLAAWALQKHSLLRAQGPQRAVHQLQVARCLLGDSAGENRCKHQAAHACKCITHAARRLQQRSCTRCWTQQPSQERCTRRVKAGACLLVQCCHSQHAGVQVCAVVSQPGRPRGRGKQRKPQPSPVEATALAAGCKRILCPASARDVRPVPWSHASTCFQTSCMSMPRCLLLLRNTNNAVRL